MIKISYLLSKRFMKARISGTVLEVRQNEYEKKNGEKVSEHILLIFQTGQRELVEVRIPSTEEIVWAEGSLFDEDCLVLNFSWGMVVSLFVSPAKK